MRALGRVRPIKNVEGPPGAPVLPMAEKLEKQYGYSAINLTALLRTCLLESS